MRQIADRGVKQSQLSQTTLNTCGETNVAPEAFSLNQNSAVCLPVVSDSQKLIWVPSNQIDLQLNGTAELEKAFDRFPYLTEKETAALAQCCSLHSDQVKVWFMLQRLRYGISWDSKDIQDVRNKVKQSQGKAEIQNRVGKEIKSHSKEKKRRVNESDEKKAREVREEQSTSDGKMKRENVKANEQLERKIKHEKEKPVKKVKDRKVEKEEKDKTRATKKKRKRVTVDNSTGKKRMKQVDGGVVERAGEEEIKGDQKREQQKFIQSEKTISTRKKKGKVNKTLIPVQEWPAVKNFVVPDGLLDVSPLLPQTQAFNVPPLSDRQTEQLKRDDLFLPTTSNILNLIPVNSNFEEKLELEARLEEEPHVDPNHNVVITDVGKVKELFEMNNLVVAESSPIVALHQNSHVEDPCAHPSQIHCRTKTQSQLALMKMAFSHCQYPEREDYDRLATVIGIPRYMLVQWFGDMRYYIKRGKPRWMTKEQHSQVLANVMYQQCINALAKVKPVEGFENTTWNLVLERSENADESESVNMLPDNK